MAVKGPPPSLPRPLPAPKAKPGRVRERPSGDGKDPKVKGAPKAKNLGNIPVDTDADEHAAFERHHAEELEEETRRHFHAAGESEARRDEGVEHEHHLVERISWGEEKNKRGRRDRDDTEDADAEEAAKAAAEAKAKGLASADGAGKYFQDMPEDRMGDLSLTDPNEMKRVLGPSARFAQHAMLLAQNRMDTGGSRAEAIQMLADLYTRLGDRAYANKALREFGPATGILDIYPLEVAAHLMEHVPHFFSKVERGRFMSSSQVDGYRAKVGEPIALAYPPELRIRGFALKDGPRPGYLLEPTDPPGTYALTFLAEGRFEVIISAISRDGRLLLEEFVCAIEAADDADEEPTAIRRERTNQAEDAEGDKAERAEKKGKKEDLTFHFPRRI
ncbi:MAG: hypothetical protein KC933_22065 [Myxococcales bacterium]|nr:hypothetical protein [Myxococcales bacterium]